jgi:hypothetical protein
MVQVTDKFFFINLDKESKKRFELAKFFNYTDNYDPLTSFVYSEFKDIPVSGFFKIQGQDGRPDLISYEIFNDTQYWWLLMLYNDISTVEGFVTGMDIKYPSIGDMEDLYFSLKISEQANSKV